ncbi:MAG: hypothetical protein IMZ50_14885 [Candidatus Atribacteria bacterium]|nr:hypothetical protein [Candidatus Atribacteria bacterium]
MSKKKQAELSPPSSSVDLAAAARTEARPGVPLSPQKGREVKPAFRPRPGDPLSPAPEAPGSGSSSITSKTSPVGSSGVLIDDEIAGELANAPFTLINIFEPAWEAMNDAQMMKIGRALRVYLENKGITELKHPELLILVAGYGYLSQQFKNVKKAAKERKAAKAHVTDDRRAEGDGKNVPGVVGDPKVEGR